LQRRFEADYLDSPNIPNRAKYEQAVQALFKKFGDTQVLFSGFVDKVNRKGKIDKRSFVVTEQHIYKQNPKDYKVKTFGIDGFGIPIIDLEGISMSPNADGFVVLHVNTHIDKDALIDVGTKPEKLSELVTVLVTAYNKLTNKDLPVRFSNE
jgi:myosin-1